MSNATPSASAQAIGHRLESVVVKTRRRYRRAVLLTGAGLLVATTLGWLVLAASLDMLVPLPVPLRIAAWLVFWGLLVTLAVRGLVIPYLRRDRLDQIALKIEHVIPGMHNRLLTVLDLNQGQGPREADRDFIDHLLRQARQKMEGFRTEWVVSPRPVRRSLTAAGAIACLGLMLLLLLNDRMPTAVARIMRPTAPIAPVSWVKLQAQPGDTEVLQGEPVTLQAIVERGDVEQLEIRLRQAGQNWTTYPMTPAQADRFAFDISAVESSLEYQILGGKTWTPVHQVAMVRRPIIENLQAQVHLPAYMKLPEPRSVDPAASQISAPVGAAIQVAAKVEGQVQRGAIQLYQASTQERTDTQERETVWFDDHLPGDAEIIGDWRWTTTAPYSGTRAHTFDWKREPYGFRTRLNALTLAPDEHYFIYARLDRANPPRRVSMRVLVNDQERWLNWLAPDLLPRDGDQTADPQAEPAPDAAPGPGDPLAPRQPGSVHTLPTDQQGQWVRLAVPASALLNGQGGDSAKIQGLQFEIDGGRVAFDRSGKFMAMARTDQVETFEPVQRLDMTYDEAAGQWVGQIPVDQDTHWALVFRNRLGHANRPMKPVRVVATADQPPAVLIEKPKPVETILQPAPMPLVVRAFDDYGVAAVGLEVGPAKDQLEAPTWLQTYDAPQRNRLMITTLDPQSRDLQPGQSLFYRLVVRDTKDQTTHSDVYEVRLIAPNVAQGEADTSAPTPLDSLLEGIGQMVRLPERAAGSVVDLVQGVLPEVRPLTNEAGEIIIVDAQGQPVDPERLQGMMQQRWGEMTPEQRQALVDQIAQQDAATQARLQQLAQQFEQAALAADDSALALPMEGDALREIADRLAEMAKDNPPTNAEELDADVLDRLARLRELTPEQEAELEALQQQLQELMAAHQTLPQNPDAAMSQMARLATLQAAQRAMQQMSQMQGAMQSKREQLEALRQRTAALQQQAQQAQGAEMDQVGQQQQELDEEAIAAMREARAMAQDQMAMMEAAEDDLPAPWTPPGREVEAMPVERDTPEEDPADAQGDQAAGSADAEEAEEEDNWWDQPVNHPDIAQQARTDERFEDRDTRPVEPSQRQAAQGDQPPTPREMLREHQEAMEQALTENSNEVGGAMSQAQQLQSQMQALMGQMAGSQQAQGSPSAPNQTDSDAQAGEAAMQALQQMLASAPVRQMMARAQAMAAGQGQGKGQASGQADPAPPPSPAASSDGGTNPRPSGPILMMRLENLELTTDQRQAVYRLPRELRDAMIQGMQERGPDGYQPLIDAYYRELSQPARPGGEQ